METYSLIIIKNNWLLRYCNWLVHVFRIYIQHYNNNLGLVIFWKELVLQNPQGSEYRNHRRVYQQDEHGKALMDQGCSPQQDGGSYIGRVTRYISFWNIGKLANYVVHFDYMFLATIILFLFMICVNWVMCNWYGRFLAGRNKNII